MCISAPKTALVLQPCIDAQMAARGISRSPKSAVTGLEFSPRCCSKYLWLRFNASFPFPSLKQESVLEVRMEPELWPLQLRSAFCCPAWVRCHPRSWAQPCRGQCRRDMRGTPVGHRRDAGGDNARRAVLWAPAGFYTPCFNQAKEQSQRRAAASRNCLKRLRQQRPSWRVRFLGHSAAAAPETQDPLIAIEQGFPFLVRAQT